MIVLFVFKSIGGLSVTRGRRRDLQTPAAPNHHRLGYRKDTLYEIAHAWPVHLHWCQENFHDSDGTAVNKEHQELG